MGLDFNQLNSSLEGTVMQMKLRVDRMHAEMYGPENSPEAGFVKRFDLFVNDHKAREEEREKAVEQRHRQNRFRLNTIIAILAGILIPLTIALLRH